MTMSDMPSELTVAYRTLLLGLLTAVLLVPGHAMAAGSYDNCRGFIDTLPATISGEGTWCLRKHLYTSQVSGNAITVGVENVTIDCNGFRVSGLGAGAATQATGIRGLQRGATVRGCRVEGFATGIAVGGGSLVEDNSVEMSTQVGIDAYGRADGGVARVRRNRVLDTGVGTIRTYVYGIKGYRARIEDNQVLGLMQQFGSHAGIAIEDGMVRRNRVESATVGFGIVAGAAAVIDNSLSARVVGDIGIYIPGEWITGDWTVPHLWYLPVACRGNVLQRFEGPHPFDEYYVPLCYLNDNTVQPWTP
ncbi:right-handed parallel beta-helix repeat-containing protein [Agrilutibacter solisilvae]|uniref:Right-handed parallel beta-helix repeat-containing protein n=1 Tax=Agrilutibacter solisilvae TaxID=2763317 RepID=A0A974Y217_9GAMM|nr:right-handed parallel beta-helix repeat-containing protein [Lysobacter solisilvae]QSX79083.1 right-handed parallel beta-helix repeat-containing protein [Lysobacter solisilvae]